MTPESSPYRALSIGRLQVWPPVVLAPMAGVTNAPFRRLCRQHGAGLYVNEMIGARALVNGDPKTAHLAGFPPDETPRSIQLYGTSPEPVAEAVALLIGEQGADHIDLNFGCPAPKITRHGGGAALPYRLDLFRSIVRAAVQSAGDVPITVKYRKGIDDDHLTYLSAGRVAEEEGAAAVGLHARTAEQLYSGSADWSAIARLKETLSVPVLGNGDIWEAADAMRMVAETGCDGVIVGRGCLGRPWLFGDLARAFEGDLTVSVPTLGEVCDVMMEHARLLVAWFDLFTGIRSFRKHTGWYLKGYPAGPEVRRRLSVVEDLDELGAILAELDQTALPHEGATRMTRGHSHGPRPVRLPYRYLEGEWDEALPAEAELAVSGG
jgi:nifR3 family TIM-barrel protein